MSEAITLDLARKAIAAARELELKMERGYKQKWTYPEASCVLDEDFEELCQVIVLWSGAFGAMLDLLEESMLMSPKSAPRFWALLTPASRDALSALAESLDRADPGWRER